MSSRKYYPPAPLVVATTASGARLTDMFRICHGAFVGASWAWLWLWRWLGWTERLQYGTLHRCQHAVVSCMEEVAFLLLAVAPSMLHATWLHAACCMLHAACCMLHDASGAQGEWLELVCGGNLTDFPRGFSSTVCRSCRTLTSMVLPHLPVILQPHRQVLSTRPSPHLRRARILPRGLPPRICPGNPPHSCPLT